MNRIERIKAVQSFDGRYPVGNSYPTSVENGGAFFPDVLKGVDPNVITQPDSSFLNY